MKGRGWEGKGAVEVDVGNEVAVEVGEVDLREVNSDGVRAAPVAAEAAAMMARVVFDILTC